MERNYILEACVESLAEAQIAEQRGAQQIELCDRLDVGGTTPPRAVIEEAQRSLDLNIKVMIRPRGGSFVYSEAEMIEMEKSILFCKNIGIFGVVFGNLHPDNNLHINQIKRLADLAAPMEVTIHRAIDETPDIFKAIAQLKLVPTVNCILSAGQSNTAKEGAARLRAMVDLAGPAIKVIPGGKVTKENVAELHEIVGAEIYHGTKIVGVLDSK